MEMYSLSKDSLFRDYPLSEESTSTSTSATSSGTSDSDDDESWYCINPSCEELKFETKYEWIGHVITKHPSLKHIYLLQSDLDWYYRQTPIMFERELEKIEKEKRRKIKRKRMNKKYRREKKPEKDVIVVEDDDKEDNLYYCFYNDCMTSSGFEREVDFIRHVYAQHPENTRLFTKKQKDMYRKEMAIRRKHENLGVEDISPTVTPRTIKPTRRITKSEEDVYYSNPGKNTKKKDKNVTPILKRIRKERGSQETTPKKSPSVDPQERKKEIIRDYKIRRKIKYPPPKDITLSTNSLELLSTDPMEIERFGEIEGYEELEFEEHGEIQDTDRTVRGVKSEMSKIRNEINREVRCLKFVDDSKEDELERKKRRRRRRRRKRQKMMRRINGHKK